MAGTIKIKKLVETGFAGADHTDYEEVDKGWWESLSDGEKDEFLNEIAVEYLYDRVSCSAWVEEE